MFSKSTSIHEAVVTKLIQGVCDSVPWCCSVGLGKVNLFVLRTEGAVNSCHTVWVSGGRTLPDLLHLVLNYSVINAH